MARTFSWGGKEKHTQKKNKKRKKKKEKIRYTE